MRVLRLLAARHAMSTTTTARSKDSEQEEDEGPFFDLDFASSVRSYSSCTSGSDSYDACSELDFIISLHRRGSASPLMFCASEPSTKARQGLLLQPNLRTLSFGAKNKAAFYGQSLSFGAKTTRSFRLFPADVDSSEPTKSSKREGAPSRDVIMRYLTKISRRLWSVRRPRSAGDKRRRLRKSRSASASMPPSRRDDSLIEKQDGIASAIAHCKESFHRASLSELDSSLLRSRSDPGKCEASS